MVLLRAVFSRVTKPFAFSSCRSSRSLIFQLRGRRSCSDPQEEKIPSREQSSKPNSCGAFEAGERRCGLDGREVAQYHGDERIQDIADGRRTRRGVHSALRLDGLAQLWVDRGRAEGWESMAPTKRKRTERVQLMVSADELSAINEFRFHARMPNLAAAVRELIKRGMGSVKKKIGPQNQCNPTSG